MPDRIVVVDGHTLCPGHPDPLNWEPVASLGELVVHERTGPEELHDRVAGASMVLTNKVAFDGATLAALPPDGVRYIGVLATGYNVVDVAAAGQRGITVTNVPSYSTDSVAQLVFALLLELMNKTSEHVAAVRAGRWASCPDFSFTVSPIQELAGKALGIVGMGSIGKRVAQIGAAFGMQILAAHQSSMNRVLLPGFDVEWLPVDDLFARADVVTLHCPLTEQTQGLANAKRIGRMKPTAYLINTGRGALVVEAALAAALSGGAIAGAALDVLSVEPPAENHPLLKAPRCIVTPHIAWATVEARRRLMQIAANNIKAFQMGNPLNVVTA
jgi:glycerate dehydrogenase